MTKRIAISARFAAWPSPTIAASRRARATSSRSSRPSRSARPPRARADCVPRDPRARRPRARGWRWCRRRSPRQDRGCSRSPAPDRRRHRLAGARIQRIVRHLRGVERARCDQAMQRLGLADRREADEARPALPARAIERGHDVAQHFLDAHRDAVGARRDRVVQLKYVDMVAPQPARLASSDAAIAAPMSGRSAGTRTLVESTMSGFSLRARGRHSAPRRRPHRTPRCRT